MFTHLQLDSGICYNLITMILYSQWLSLPISTRHKIASEFNIIKKGITHVVDNQVKDDGYHIKDIESALTMHNLQKYFGTTESDPAILWSYLVDKMEGKNIQLVENIPVIVPVIEPIKKKSGRPKKQ